MRVTLEGTQRQTFPVEFEPAPHIQDGRHITLRAQRHPTEPAISMQLPRRRGVGYAAAVWDSATGQLLWVPNEHASDIAWSPDRAEVFVLAGRLFKYDWPGRRLLDELSFVIGGQGGGGDFLVVSPRGNLAAVVFIQQGDWYYEVLNVRPEMSQPGIGRHMLDWLGDCPAFSPDERYLVAVGSPGDKWWWAGRGEEDWDEPDEPPSTGGPHDLGVVCVHDLTTNQVSEHPLVVDLPEGWQPVNRADDVAGFGWKNVWGPEFRGERAFRLWLPDGAPLDLELPLPETVMVPGISPTWRGG